MGIQVSWDNDTHTIIRFDLDEHWTWDEFYTATDKAIQMVDSVPHNTGTIFNVTGQPSLPNDILTHSKNLIKQRHPRTLIIAIVAQGTYIRSVLNMTATISNEVAQLLIPASALDEARTLINERLQIVRG